VTIKDKKIRLFGLLLVALLELVDSSRRIHQHILTREERMGSIRNFQFDQGIFVTVFVLDRLVRLCRRLAKESDPIAHVFENNKPVTLRMDIFFHNSFCLRVVRIWPYDIFYLELAKVGIFNGPVK